MARGSSPAWPLAIVVALTALLYLPALGNDFVNWDDDDYVFRNPRLREHSLAGLGSYFVERDAHGAWSLPNVQGNYHPLTMLSLGLDAALSGLDVPKAADRETDIHAAVFHLTNVLWHLANTALVFLLIAAWLSAAPDDRAPRTVGTPTSWRVPFFCALLFGTTTLHVESVAWVAERKDVLYTFFFLLALWLYTRYVRAPRALTYVAVLGAFIGALLSKGQAVTLAPTLVAVDLLLARPLRARRVLLEKLPFFLLALVFGAIAVYAQAADGNVLARAARYPLYMRPLFASYALVQYAVKLFVPVHLQALYPYAWATRQAWALYVIYVPAVLAALVWLVRARRRTPVLAFGLLFFLLNVAPVLQLLPVGAAIMADRYSYVPSIGLFLMAAWGIEAALRAHPRRTRAIYAAVGAYLVILSVATVDRIGVWRNSVTLWTDELSRNPASASAYNNLGTYYFRVGKMEEALSLFEKAIALDPESRQAYTNRGMIRDQAGQTALARTDYDRALELNPEQPLVLNNRALIRQDAGDLVGAREDLSKALAFMPDNVMFLANRARVEAALGQTPDALGDYARALERDPDRADLYSERATLRAESGDLSGAIDDFGAVIRLLPAPYTYANRAHARAEARDCAGAAQDLLAAKNLGPVPDEALAHFKRACGERP
jgi:tetratricopeptide (TPR) repeat protein